MSNTQFSVIVPTFTGARTISDCLDSILNQKVKEKFEIIIVIDGPNEKLAKICKNYEQKFVDRNIPFKTYKFKKNQGRFEARLKGARQASSKKLLFLDDRITFDKDYFETILKLKKPAAIPNVLESEHPHFVARTLYLLRRRIYGTNWGRDFQSYEISADNFEQSPKGTTSFWIKKNDFIEVCENMKKQYSDFKNINEDTKVMRAIVDHYYPIYRSSEAKIYYSPRHSPASELTHIYERAPRFMDYYFKRSSRYFFPLLLFFPLSIISSTLIVIFAVYNPVILAIVSSIAYVVLGLLLAEKPVDVIMAPLGMGLLFLYFGFGLWQSAIRKALR